MGIDMKKIICMLLVLVMVMSLCACGESSGSKTPTELQVGFGREDVTPQESVPMGGYGNPDQRFSKQYLDYLYATCIAITGTNGETVLLFTLDLLNAPGLSTTNEWTKAISEKTGVPQANMQFHGTHSHSTPSLGDVEYNSIVNYRALMQEKLVLAAEAAMADRADAKIFVGKVEVPGMNFVRHYLMSDGSYAGSNFGTFANLDIVDHAEVNDPIMQIVKFDKIDETKKDIYLMNWAAHPCFTGGMEKYDLSADFIGPARDYVEKQTGGHCAYFTGAAGNQNTNSQIDAEAHNLNKQTYGEKLGEYLVNALPELTQVEGTEVQILENNYVGTINHEKEDLLDQARPIYQYYLDTNDRSGANQQAREIGLSSVYHARAIVNRSKMDKTEELELNAINVGNLAFIGAPYEMFAQSSIDIKAGSPFDMTVIMTMQHGHAGYIPTQIAYDYGCYESHTGRFAPGTAELLVQEYLTMLNTLHETAK